jgi:arylsulfatase
LTREAFFYYRGAQLYAARRGPWKAHWITRTAYGPDKPQPHDPPLLFHLERDAAETFNVASQNLAVLKEIAEATDRHRATLRPVKSQLEGTVPR